jgi:hypothetical protein
MDKFCPIYGARVTEANIVGAYDYQRRSNHPRGGGDTVANLVAFAQDRVRMH